MKIAEDHVRRLARERGWSLSALLRRAGVSRTAYYSLARRPNVLPKTIQALARTLDVPESSLLDAVPSRLREARMIFERQPDAAFENVWHTLALLELTPIERLNRSLLRGRAVAVHG